MGQSKRDFKKSVGRRLITGNRAFTCVVSSLPPGLLRIALALNPRVALLWRIALALNPRVALLWRIALVLNPRVARLGRIVFCCCWDSHTLKNDGSFDSDNLSRINIGTDTEYRYYRYRYSILTNYSQKLLISTITGSKLPVLYPVTYRYCIQVSEKGTVPVAV
jgi:hypothetical protein